MVGGSGVGRVGWWAWWVVRGVGARRGGGPKGWEPELLGPLWVFSRGILVVFEAPGRSNVRVWSSLVVV